MIFNCNEDTSKFFYLYENVVTEGLLVKEKNWKIVSDLAGSAFDFYFDRFTMDNGLTDKDKDYG